MKQNTGILLAIIPFVAILGCYLVFYSRIESKPNHPGFWFIFTLGMSFGVLLVRFFLWLKTK